MAVSVTDSTQIYSRTTALPSFATFSVSGWFYFTDVTAATAAIFVRNSNTWWMVYVTPNSSQLNLYDGTTEQDAGHAVLSINTWYHVAATRSGASGNIVYLNGVAGTTLTDTTPAGDERVFLGHAPISLERLNGRMASVKLWDGVVLTAAEIQQEMRRYRPWRTANLHAFWPFLSTADDEIDYSGNAKTLTVGGTPGNADGPPVSWGTARPRVRQSTISPVPPYTPRRGIAPTQRMA